MTLKRELEAPTSPLRVTLDRLLPDLSKSMRTAWNAHMKSATAEYDPALPADVLGHAISERIAWQFSGTGGHLPGKQILLWAGADPDMLDHLAAELHRPCPGVDNDREARVACLVGLADRAYRSARTDEPWYQPLLTCRTLDDALSAVDPAWVHDVTTTTAKALTALAQLTAEAPTVTGPVFTGSKAVGGADGDLILGTVLVEVKTGRTTELRKRDLQQVVTYALLDWDNQHALTEVAILAARHGVLVRWPLNSLIEQASRGEVDLGEARARLRGALT